MKVKTGQKEAYALDNGANEKQTMVGNYLPSSISQRVWPSKKTHATKLTFPDSNMTSFETK